MNETKITVTDYGMTLCASCGAELECNHETGDMPDHCPVCHKLIDWSDFLPGGPLSF